MKRKLVAVFMAALMSMSLFTACAQEKEKEDKDNNETTDSTVVESDESEKSSETDSEPSTTEETIDMSLYQEGSFYDIEYGEEYGKMFHSFREKITEINAEHPDEVMYYGTGDGPQLYYRSEFKDDLEWPCLIWNSESDEYVSFDAYVNPFVAFTYEDFMKLPRIVYRSNGKGPCRFEDSVPDGEYYGEIVAVSVDTKKVLMIVEEPVIISAEEFSKLTPGYHVSAADSDPYFEYPELDVSENYDPADPTTMFDDYCLMFVPRESGDYMLVDYEGEYWQRLGINSRYVFLDLDPECEIDDYKTPTLVDTFTPFGFSDGPTTLARSMIYCDIIRNASKYAYDGWIGVAITVKPCYIENNTIKSMRVSEHGSGVPIEFA